MAKHTKHVVWREFDITIPGCRITVENVQVLYALVLEVTDDINIDTVTVILQLFNNSVHIYRGQARRLETSPLARQEWCVPHWRYLDGGQQERSERFLKKTSSHAEYAGASYSVLLSLLLRGTSCIWDTIWSWHNVRGSRRWRQYSWWCWCRRCWIGHRHSWRKRFRRLDCQVRLVDRSRPTVECFFANMVAGACAKNVYTCWDEADPESRPSTSKWRFMRWTANKQDLIQIRGWPFGMEEAPK